LPLNTAKGGKKKRGGKKEGGGFVSCTQQEKGTGCPQLISSHNTRQDADIRIERKRKDKMNLSGREERSRTQSPHSEKEHAAASHPKTVLHANRVERASPTFSEKRKREGTCSSIVAEKRPINRLIP